MELKHDDIVAVEYAVLGGLLTNPETVGSACTELTPDLFSQTGTKGVYKAIEALHLDGAPVDRVTVRAKLGPEYDAALDECERMAVSDVLYYCGLLRDYSRLWELHVLGLKLSATDTLDAAVQTVGEINRQTVQTEKRSQGANLVDLVMEYCRGQGKKQQAEYITFPWAALNEVCYVERGDFVVIGGYSSAGKTMLSLQFALHMAKKYRVGYFSFETSKRKIADRVIAAMTRTQLQKIKRKELTNEDYKAAAKAGNELMQMQGALIIHEAGGMTVLDIQTIALAERYDVVFVDYLQIVGVSGKSQDGDRAIYNRVTTVSQGLHTLAQRNKVTVVALAQLNRPEKTKGKPIPPSMWSFKESGQIENDADVAMLLYPNDPDDNKSSRHLKISKNKDGEKFEMDLQFFGATQIFVPYSKGTKRQVEDRKAKAAEAAREQLLTKLATADDGLPFGGP